MIDVRAIARNPGWQLVVGGALLALAFPSRLPGAIGLACVCGGLGIGAGKLWVRLPQWLRVPSDGLATAFVLTIVIVLGLDVFLDAMTDVPDWLMGDWGPQRAVLAKIMPSLPALDPPVWNHYVGTGDAPLELYPKLAYLVAGHLAWIADLDPGQALVITAVLVHVALAATTTALALRVAPKLIGLAIGILTLVEGGAVAHGGPVGLFRWGLLHSALALWFATCAALGILSALRRPRLRATIAIWLGTALACAAHPAGLIAASACVVGLAGVALFAGDVPPRRALVAILHVAIGVALGAFAWMPLAERILDYGQHFPNPIRTAARLLEDLLYQATPTTHYAMLGYAGYLGIIAGLWSRRAAAVFLAVVSLVLLVGLCDTPYLALDLVPGKGVARLGTERLAQLARPFLAASAAYAIWCLVAQGIAAWRQTSPRRQLVALAAIGVMTAAVAREWPAFWRSNSNRAYNETQVLAPDRASRDALTRWAAARAAEERPDAWSRVLFETETHEHFHLTALTGLPTLHYSAQPDLLLRERIEDLTPRSLHRFDVHWTVALDHDPLFGDPATQFTVGHYFIRSVKDWDGQFARIERGKGTVKTTRLDDTAVEIEVTGTEPVLVALGTGYYPRWRATHASGADEPVFAMHATEGGNLSVVSAWVAPGKTTFTCDGPLPSDGKGRWIAILALVLAIAIVVAWSRPRWRWRVLREVARLRARAGRWSGRAAQIGVPLLLIILFARGCTSCDAPIDALEVGGGIRPSATVEARLGPLGEWQECDYHRVQSLFICDGLVVVHDGMVELLNDAPPSWGFNTPGILASADVPGVEMRIKFHARLKGTYWVATSGDDVHLEVANEPRRTIDRTVLVYGDDGERYIEVRGPAPVTLWQFTMVREQTILPNRDFLEPPPLAAPEAVRQIH